MYRARAAGAAGEVADRPDVDERARPAVASGEAARRAVVAHGPTAEDVGEDPLTLRRAA